MKKTLLATSIALTLGTTTAQGAFTSLSDGSYQMTITGGCFELGNCISSGSGALQDNTSAQASIDITSTSGALSAGTYGSGIAGDGLMGVIDFTLSSGNISVTSFSQDSYLNTPFGTFFLYAPDVSGMSGSIDTAGNMTFDPTGSMALTSLLATGLGANPWNIDNTGNGLGTGLYDTWVTGTSSNRKKGCCPGFTLTGSALQDAGAGTWTGTLVIAGNIGSAWNGLDNTLYSNVYDITITASAVPVSAAVWLFGSGLAGLIGVARRRRSGRLTKPMQLSRNIF